MCNELFDSSHSILNMILRYICDCHYFCQCALFFYVTAIQCDSSFGSLYLLQLSPGHIYNIGAAEQAVKHIKSLGLFSSADLIPRPDETKDGGVVVEFQLRELEPRSAGVNTDWSIVPGDQGRPTLASIKPGGTLSFGHRNISGLNRSLAGSVTARNLLNPKHGTSSSIMN